MRRNLARGSRHRGSGIGYHGIRNAVLNKAALGGLGSLMLAACATTSQRSSQEASLRTEIAPPAETAAEQKPSPAQIMIDTATSMIGQPYRFGGSEPGGFDCSGLVFYAAANAGIRVPRTAAEQLEFGFKVGRAGNQPGDLGFMHLSRKGLHVGNALDRQLVV